VTEAMNLATMSVKWRHSSFPLWIFST